MDPNKPQSKTFEHFFNIKEKKITASEYVMLKKAFLEGLIITKEWLLNIEQNNQEYKELIEKVLNHINFQTIEYDLRMLDMLRTDETAEIFKFLDSQVVLRPSVVTKTTSISPKQKKIVPVNPPTFKSKEDLKNEINALYQHQENYDLCLTKTSELLQHPNLTSEEKDRYTSFYHELHEWVNLKNQQQGEGSEKQPITPPTESKPTITESRGTSISQLRTDMLKELQKLRQIYIDPSDK